ncbi:MAG: hypothetical protein HOM61_07035 [Candidatus Marinimicrobia bacterium]|jgi:ketol-acid reductoisomerase|nr:hypothetical protein [Candidatus Neomarinimicrobiota bacterium]MBT5955135.1 hypothetical protein [Candidatus Neomarinimicrobiota bacterium]MBT6871113.1 hypothetical protein [Candidatus Neomarinimicrobiota bacterium]
MLRFLVCVFSLCLLFSGTDLKKEKGKLKGRKLWLSYDNTLISDLEKQLQKIEKGEYSDKKTKEILAIADEYFKIRDANEKRKISSLIKKLNKTTK